MARPVDKQFAKPFLARTNSALLLGLVCGGLAICAFGAVVLDLSRLFME